MFSPAALLSAVGSLGSAYLLTRPFFRRAQGTPRWRRRVVVDREGRRVGAGIELLIRGVQQAVAVRVGPPWEKWRAVGTLGSGVTMATIELGEYRTCGEAKRAILRELPW